MGLAEMKTEVVVDLPGREDDMGLPRKVDCEVDDRVDEAERLRVVELVNCEMLVVVIRRAEDR